MFAPATKSCEIEKKIAVYHLNNLNNNFSANYILSFTNGTPTDEIRSELEQAIGDKYCSPENAGRPLISYCDSKEHAPEILKLDSEDWGEKYQSLKKDSRQDIYACFRCTPNLLGVPTETTGFSEQEYAQNFKIFSRSFIQPRQKTICSIIDSLFGQENSIKIEPFTIDFQDDGDQVEEITSTKITEENGNN